MITARARKIFSEPAPDGAIGGSGIVMQSDGTVLVGFNRVLDDWRTDWWSRAPKTTTWIPRTAVPYGADLYSFQPANAPANIAIAPTTENNGYVCALYRSQDHAQTWTEIFHRDTLSQQTGRTLGAYSVISVRKNQFVAAGQFEPLPGNPPQYIIRSTDGGETWQEMDQSQTPAVQATAIGLTNAGGGRLFYGMQNATTADDSRQIYRSDDYGAAWSPVGKVPLHSNMEWCDVLSITALTMENICASGDGFILSGDAPPGLWWSADGGNTWTGVPASAVANWANTQSTSTIHQIHRIAKTVVVCAIDNYEGNGASPWRISIDSGHTYPYLIEAEAASYRQNMLSTGSICMLRDGGVLLPALATDDWENYYHEVWAAKIEC